MLAVDVPRGAGIASRLVEIAKDHDDIDAVIPADDDGQLQWLCSAFRVEPLRRALDGLTTVNGAVRDLRHHLRIQELHEPEITASLRDIDTVTDLRAARQTKGDDPMLDSWVTAVKDDLGLPDTPVDIDRLLDLARVAAHNVDRPAAPLTTFLAGLAVASGQNLDDVIALASKHRWGPVELLSHVVEQEAKERARKSMERRRARAKLGRFGMMADFDWAWPTRIDRPATGSGS